MTERGVLSPLRRGEVRDDEPADGVDDTHALFLATVELQMPKSGVLPVVREGTMGGVPSYQADAVKPTRTVLETARACVAQVEPLKLSPEVVSGRRTDKLRLSAANAATDTSVTTRPAKKKAAKR